MLARFPLTSRSDDTRVTDRMPRGASCSLCGKDDSQEDMIRTRCCNQVKLTPPGSVRCSCLRVADHCEQQP